MDNKEHMEYDLNKLDGSNISQHIKFKKIEEYSYFNDIFNDFVSALELIDDIGFWSFEMRLERGVFNVCVDLNRVAQELQLFYSEIFRPGAIIFFSHETDQAIRLFKFLVTKLSVIECELQGFIEGINVEDQKDDDFDFTYSEYDIVRLLNGLSMTVRKIKIRVNNFIPEFQTPEALLKDNTDDNKEEERIKNTPFNTTEQFKIFLYLKENWNYQHKSKYVYIFNYLNQVKGFNIDGDNYNRYLALKRLYVVKRFQPQAATKSSNYDEIKELMAEYDQL